MRMCSRNFMQFKIVNSTTRLLKSWKIMRNHCFPWMRAPFQIKNSKNLLVKKPVTSLACMCFCIKEKLSKHVLGIWGKNTLCQPGFCMWGAQSQVCVTTQLRGSPYFLFAPQLQPPPGHLVMRDFWGQNSCNNCTPIHNAKLSRIKAGWLFPPIPVLTIFLLAKTNTSQEGTVFFRIQLLRSNFNHPH